MRILLVGSGSGGHLCPLQALEMELLQQQCTFAARYLMTNHPFDLEFAANCSSPVWFHSDTRFAKGGLLGVTSKLCRAIWEIRTWYRESPWDLVVTTGGYGAVPACLHAVISGVPLFLVEPNGVAGKVNRFFAGFAKRIYTHFPEVLSRYAYKVRSFGTPLRFAKPPQGSGDSLLVFGASLGAESINRFMAQLLTRGLNLPVIWITGHKTYADYAHYNSTAVQVLPFAADMQALYARAGLILARAGAGTVAEIEEYGIPSILVPYPYHKDRQQYFNAAHLQRLGCSFMVEDEQLQDFLDGFMVYLNFASPQYLALKHRAQELSPRNASTKVVMDLVNVWKSHSLS